MSIHILAVNKANGKTRANWDNWVRGLVSATKGGASLPLRVMNTRKGLVPDSDIVQWPDQVLLVTPNGENHTVVGSIMVSNSKVIIPDDVELPRLLMAEGLRAALNSMEDESCEVFLVGRIWLNEHGYSALLLSDEPEKFKEYNKPVDKSSTTKVKQKTKIGAHTLNSLHYGRKAMKESLKAQQDLARATADIAGRGVSWTGRALSRIGRRLENRS